MIQQLIFYPLKFHQWFRMSVELLQEVLGQTAPLLQGDKLPSTNWSKKCWCDVIDMPTHPVAFLLQQNPTQEWKINSRFYSAMEGPEILVNCVYHWLTPLAVTGPKATFLCCVPKATWYSEQKCWCLKAEILKVRSRPVRLRARCAARLPTFPRRLSASAVYKHLSPFSLRSDIYHFKSSAPFDIFSLTPTRHQTSSWHLELHICLRQVCLTCSLCFTHTRWCSLSTTQYYIMLIFSKSDIWLHLIFLLEPHMFFPMSSYPDTHFHCIVFCANTTLTTHWVWLHML